MRTVKRWALALAVAASGLLVAGAQSAQAQEAAAAPAAAPAAAAPAAAATPSLTDLAAKVQLVEAYINNGDPKARLHARARATTAS